MSSAFSRIVKDSMPAFFSITPMAMPENPVPTITIGKPSMQTIVLSANCLGQYWDHGGSENYGLAVYRLPMPSRALSRDESKAITRKRLLDGAARLLGEVGSGGLSTSAVARAAGVAQPTFYVHFRDMDDLVRALGTERIGALRARLRAAREEIIAGRGVDAVRESFRVSVQTWIENPGLFRLYAQEMQHPTSPVGKMARELRAEVHADLAQDLIRLGLPASTKGERERVQMV